MVDGFRWTLEGRTQRPAGPREDPGAIRWPSEVIENGIIGCAFPVLMWLINVNNYSIIQLCVGYTDIPFFSPSSSGTSWMAAPK